MNHTIDFIKENRIPLHTKICNTGIIFYDLNQIRNIRNIPLQKMLKDIYSTCVRLKQPQCQIVWAVLSSPYQQFIQKIHFLQIDVEWKEPPPYELFEFIKYKKTTFKTFNIFNTFNTTIFFLFLLFLLCLSCYVLYKK